MCKNWFGYMRISTAEERGLQKFSRQESKLNRWQEENNIKLIYIGRDDATGANFNREDWQRIDKLATEGDGIIFPDLSRFTRGDTEEGYKKYMELYNRGVTLVFIDNPTLDTEYIKQLLHIAKEENLLTKGLVESIVKILIIAELNKGEQERLTISKRIKDGIEASAKKSGRPAGKLDKASDALRADITAYLTNRDIKQVDLMKKHNISRNTLVKYINLAKEGKL